MSATIFRIALRCSKAHAIIRNNESKCLGVLGTHSQVVHLSSTHGHGKPIERPKPWNYEKRPYNTFWQFVDGTLKRMDDNSKVIVVDSNVGVGKSEFAQNVAKEFDMKYFPDVGMEDLFVLGNGFDIRELDEQLPEKVQTVDLEKFLLSTDVKKVYGIGNTQLLWYFMRFFKYAEALEHLLNTGQGVVLERGVYSDMVFADALAKFGYFTRAGLDHYYELRKNSICELWKPHLFIYLDAPVSYCREQINKRGKPYEVNSKVLTDEYLRTIENAFKDKVLPTMKKTTEVLVYDVPEMPDWEIVVEDLESQDLDGPVEGQEAKFKEWRRTRDDDWNNYRMFVSDKLQLDNLFAISVPWYADELIADDDDATIYKKVVLDHPEVKYEPGYNPEKYNVLFKW